MCHSFKCAGTVSTNPAYPQIACIKTKNTFSRVQDVYFYYKSVFIVFRAKIVRKLMIFCVHALNLQFYTEAILDMVSPLNTYVIIYKSEIALKFYATVFPLAHRTLYHKRNQYFLILASTVLSVKNL